MQSLLDLLAVLRGQNLLSLAEMLEKLDNSLSQSASKYEKQYVLMQFVQEVLKGVSTNQLHSVIIQKETEELKFNVDISFRPKEHVGFILTVERHGIDLPERCFVRVYLHIEGEGAAFCDWMRETDVG